MNLENLSLYPVKEEISRNIITKPISVIIAPTASGKSILIPYGLASKKLRVFIVESKSSVTKSLYESQLLTGIDSNLVGYTTNYEEFYSQKFQKVLNDQGASRKGFINYITSTYLLNLILGKLGTPFTGIDVLILDDSSDINASILEYLWNYYYKAFNGKGVPRLVITSATVDKAYYEKLKVPIFEYNLASKNLIEVKYHDKTYGVNDFKIYQDMILEIIEVVKAETQVKNYLVFCPGKAEIEYVYDNLNKLNLDKVKLIKVYAKVVREALVEINTPFEGAKIIISSPVFESSITLDLDGVFDSMLVKMLYTSDNDSSKLMTSYISQESSIQRRGRVGRFKPGFYYIMMTKESYDNLPKRYQPAIYRMSVYNTIVKLVTAGVDLDKIIPSDLSDKFTKSQDLLITLGLFKKEGASVTLTDAAKVTNVTLTDAGKFTALVDVNIRLATFLYKNLIGRNINYTDLIIVAFLNEYTRSLLYTPSKTPEETKENYYIRLAEYKFKYFDNYKSNNDLEVYFKVFLDLFTNIPNPFDNFSEVKEWAKRNNINNHELKKILKKLKYLYVTLSKAGYKITQPTLTRENIPEIVLNASVNLQFVYFDRIVKLLRHNQNVAQYKSMTSNTSYYLIPQPGSLIVQNPPQYLINLIDYSIIKNGKNQFYITFSVPGQGTSQDNSQGFKDNSALESLAAELGFELEELSEDNVVEVVEVVESYVDNKTFNAKMEAALTQIAQVALKDETFILVAENTKTTADADIEKLLKFLSKKA